MKPNHINKPGKGQQPRPGNVQQASRKRGRESREKMQPSVRQPRQGDDQEQLKRIRTDTFGVRCFDLLLARPVGGGKLLTNVPQTIVYRSQHGFDVGHEGAPVRDFALNILHRLCCDATHPTVPVNGVHVSRLAWHAYPAFASEVLARIDLMPGEYHNLFEPFLRQWIADNRSRWERTDFSPTGSEA